jgi:phage terminase Nu1 subunit (DNA packaging protein)
MIEHDLAAEAGITELAEVAGLSRPRAKQILNVAQIKRDKYRKYPTQRALEALFAFKDASRSSGHALAGLGNIDAPQTDHMQSLAAARATAENARARKLELEVGVKEGKLIARADVETAALNFATILRNSLLGLPSRLCTTLVGRDADAIEIILADALRDALSNASDLDNYIFGIDPP